MEKWREAAQAVVVLACIQSVCALLLPPGGFAKYVKFLDALLLFAALSEIALGFI